MKTFGILSFLALGDLVLSAPNLENELYIRSPTKCSSVTAIISVLSQHGAAATSFCSSYISIPLETATSKIVVTLAAKTSTVTQTKTVTPKISVTATTTSTPTVPPILTQVLVTGQGKKRDLEERDPPPIPSYLTTFAPSKISSACSCLSITTSTTTVKTTSTFTLPTTTVTVKTTITKPPVTTTVATVVKTASTTVTECYDSAPTFILKMATSVVVNGTQLQGTYGTDHVDYEDEDFRIDRWNFNGLTDPSGAGVLYLDGSVLAGFASGFIAVRLGNETGAKALHFEDPEDLGTVDTADSCGIDGSVITCTRPDGATIWQLCPETTGFNDLFIGPTVASGCTQVAVDVVPVCTPRPAT